MSRYIYGRGNTNTNRAKMNHVTTTANNLTSTD